jgi:acetolactate synthase-1/2/3 large subunit
LGALDRRGILKVTDYIAKSLYRHGVRTVFELSGGMITHLLNSLYSERQIRILSMHHEQAAAFAADATGRMTGVPGVAMATSGPGATNLLTGIGSCYFDSSPAVFITGQVNRWELKKDRKIRQLGFQETDIVQMARPITKAAWQINEAEEVPVRMEEAFSLAVTGRPGPVLLDIPMDIQRSHIDEALIDEEFQAVTHPPALDDDAVVDDLLFALEGSKKPLILAGGGIRAGNAADAFRRLITRMGVPVVNSLMAMDVLPSEDPQRVGMIGTYGNRWANLALAASDLLIVVGSRLDVRQTGSDVEFFKTSRTIFHVDCEVGEVNNRVTGCHAIVADVRQFLAMVEAKIKNRTFPKHVEWLGEINTLRSRYSDENENSGAEGINPNVFIHRLCAASSAAGAYVVDVGQHQMWAAQSSEIKPNQRWITSGGMGSMGFSLPAGIAAAIAMTPRPAVIIAGDGAFQCNIQELQTVVRNRLPLKIVVMNNHCHGMVRQFQESYFEGRYQSTLWGYNTPDFVQIAQAYGIPGYRVETGSDIEEGIAHLWEDPSAPSLLEVKIGTLTNVYPKIAFGLPISQMEPESKPIAMEGT